MTVEEDAIWLAKAVWRLDKKGYINASGGDDSEEAECEHLRYIAIRYMEKIHKWEMERENSTQRAKSVRFDEDSMWIELQQYELSPQGIQKGKGSENRGRTGCSCILKKQ